MNPSFNAGDTILVNKLSYFLSKPRIGDIIVLRKERFVIKRIAKIKEGKFFVIGENKEESTDSRNFGWVSRKEIIGKVMFKI